jgi:hypothetical protein
MGLLSFLGEMATGYEQGKAFGEVTVLLSKDTIAARAEIIRRVVTGSNAQLDLFDAALEHAAQNSLTPWGRRHAAEVLGVFRQIRG